MQQLKNGPAIRFDGDQKASSNQGHGGKIRALKKPDLDQGESAGRSK